VYVDPAAELVALLGEDGRPCGAATRADVRRKNLLHGATAVLVRRGDGRLYVHRRTMSKDIYPGVYDCWAGGVLDYGETPEVGAARELAEELGVSGTVLRPLLVTRWSDRAVQAVYHVFETTWDGPIVHQAEEIAWGAWWTPQMLRRRLAAPDFAFVPDGRFLLDAVGFLRAGPAA
jgi:8-oxo-dGTP pyrophosphatase MutT (NUDIX family)